MGFIDQIMGAMGMEAAQTVTEEPTSNADPQRTEETKTDEVKEKAEKIQLRTGKRRAQFPFHLRTGLGRMVQPAIQGK